ncbi:Transglutaminase-like superfamily [Carpediemonas membranifera]|uniref:Transglutaminase-like superfamily n=1 Tax=Carpediemonas membranifera TaxID=201153 RepID=A0A8J6E2V4_9EUKA|nr:Transglutaminase-like superfamily [Carpediemonas membranifera]|eukprot:KAG9395138.1 Transglutaminase-like superfamily [Carpediemonas membranifera]
MTRTLEIEPEFGMDVFQMQLESVAIVPRHGAYYFVKSGQRIVLSNEKDLETLIDDGDVLYIVTTESDTYALVLQFMPDQFAARFLSILRRYRFQRTVPPAPNVIAFDKKLFRCGQEYLQTHRHDALEVAKNVIPTHLNVLKAAGPDDIALVKALASWFHREFTFIKDVPCEACGHPTCRPSGRDMPGIAEISHDAMTVELYTCPTCHRTTRVPRYRDVAYLLTHWRRGRCGEFALAFTTLCLAVGLEARMVFDLADHVWVEYYDRQRRTFVHVDPCENAVDTPLMYEKGWGKQIDVVIAVGRGFSTEVTWRYTESRDRPAQSKWPRSYVCHFLLHRMAHFVAMNVDEVPASNFDQVMADLANLRKLRAEGHPTYGDAAKPRQSGS